jgi:hypothetical protein
MLVFMICLIGVDHPLKSTQNIVRGQTLPVRNCLEGTIVADTPETEGLEDLGGFRIKRSYLANGHRWPDQPVKSEHNVSETCTWNSNLVEESFSPTGG